MFENMREKFKKWAESLPTTPSASVTTKTEEGMVLDRIRKTFETGVVNAEIGLYRWTGKGPEDTLVEDIPLFQRQQIREIVQEMGGEATVHAGLSVDLTWPTPNKRMQSIRELKHTLLYARDIDAKVVTVHPTSMQGGNAFFDTVLFSPETKGPWYGGGEAEVKMREKIASEVGWYTEEYFKRMEAWRKAHMRRTLEQAFGKGAAEVDAAIYSTGIELYMKFLQGMTQLFGFYKEAKEIEEPQAIAAEAHAEFLKQAAKILDNKNLSDDEKSAEIAALSNMYYQKALSRPQNSEVSPTRVAPYLQQYFGKYLSAQKGDGSGGVGNNKKIIEAVGQELARIKVDIAKEKGVEPEKLRLTPDIVEEYIKEGKYEHLKQLRRRASMWNPGLKGFDARYIPLTEKEFITTLVKSFDILLDDNEVKQVLNEGKVKIALENMQMTNLATGVLGSPYFTKPEHFKKALREVWKVAKRKGIKNPERVIGMTYDILHAATGMDPEKFLEELSKESVDENGEKLPAVPVFNLHLSGGPQNAYGGIAHHHTPLGSRGDMVLGKNPQLLDKLQKTLDKMKKAGLIEDTPPLTIEPGEGGTEDTEQALQTLWLSGGEPAFALYGADTGSQKEWGYDQATDEYYRDIKEEQYISEYPDEFSDSALDRAVLYSGARATFLESLYSTGGAQRDIAPAMWSGGMSHRDVAQMPKPWIERFYFTGDK